MKENQDKHTYNILLPTTTTLEHKYRDLYTLWYTKTLFTHVALLIDY